MTRFPCPQCGKRLKVSSESPHGPVTCPRCGELCAVPAHGTEEGGGGSGRHLVHEAAWPVGLRTGAGVRVRWALGLAATAMAAGILLALVTALVPADEGVLATARHCAVPLSAFSAVAILAILHGHATGCPQCGKWWAREEVGGGYRDGLSPGRCVRQTNYQCGACRHRWDVTEE